jgi:hypothetical protein
MHCSKHNQIRIALFSKGITGAAVTCLEKATGAAATLLLAFFGGNKGDELIQEGDYHRVLVLNGEGRLDQGVLARIDFR